MQMICEWPIMKMGEPIRIEGKICSILPTIGVRAKHPVIWGVHDDAAEMQAFDITAVATGWPLQGYHGEYFSSITIDDAAWHLFIEQVKIQEENKEDMKT